MIDEWRAEWGRRCMPFLLVQLPNFANKFDDDYFTLLREAQARVARQVRHTAMAVTIDTGLPDNVHPPDKQDVGHRLALLARALIYGRHVECSGPTCRSVKIRKDSIRVRFAHANQGLVDKSGPPLKGFEVAGEDEVFHAATAAIDGSSVVVQSAGVPHPRYLRYAWAPDPPADLYNADGLPAAPFRTDAP